MNVGDIIKIGPYTCKINGMFNEFLGQDVYFITWVKLILGVNGELIYVTSLSREAVEQILKKEFNITHLGYFANSLKAFNLKNFKCFDSPDFYSIQELEKFIRYLQMRILSNNILLNK